MNMLKNSYKKGFTLIELVIVIAIIAILAVGVIAALNPAEQSNRAKDGKFKNTMSEFMSAIQRWSATNTYSPFCPTATTCADRLTATDLTAASDGTTTVKSKLLSANEITTNFDTTTATDQLSIFASYTAATNQVRLCYKPVSKAAGVDTTNRYTSSAGTTAMTAGGANCPTANDPTSCYYCIVQ